MKLYTRSGDDGSTGLFGGPRVPKDAARVEAYGTVDELNAALGLAAAAMPVEGDAFRRLAAIIAEMQARLFDLGADLATPADSPHAGRIERLGPEAADRLEREIDEIDGANAPLKTFILPGGSESAARLHVARAVCRRAERRVVTLARVERINPHAVVYLNRVGDLLFAMARRANLAAGVADVEWRAGGEATKRRSDEATKE